MILMIPKINFPNENDNRFPKLASNSLFAANLHPLVDSSPLTVVQLDSALDVLILILKS